MTADTQATKTKLIEEYGIRLKDESLKEFLAETQDVGGIAKELLEYDLRLVGKAYVPKDIGSQQSAVLKGKNFLQVMKVRDVTIPLRKGKQEDVEDDFLVDDRNRHNRLLRFELTDGERNFICAEITPMKQLRDVPIPGTKVEVTDMPVKMGVGLISGKHFKPVGGSVESLGKEYTMLQESSGDRSNVKVNDADPPPPFVPFKTGSKSKAAPARTAPTKAEPKPKAQPKDSGAGKKDEDSQGAAKGGRGKGRDGGGRGGDSGGGRGGKEAPKDHGKNSGGKGGAPGKGEGKGKGKGGYNDNRGEGRDSGKGQSSSAYKPDAPKYEAPKGSQDSNKGGHRDKGAEGHSSGKGQGESRGGGGKGQSQVIGRGSERGRGDRGGRNYDDDYARLDEQGYGGGYGKGGDKGRHYDDYGYGKGGGGGGRGGGSGKGGSYGKGDRYDYDYGYGGGYDQGYGGKGGKGGGGKGHGGGKGYNYDYYNRPGDIEDYGKGHRGGKGYDYDYYNRSADIEDYGGKGSRSAGKGGKGGRGGKGGGYY